MTQGNAVFQSIIVGGKRKEKEIKSWPPNLLNFDDYVSY